VRVAARNNLLKVLPANRATATGTSPDLIFFDEARDAPDTLWEEIAPSVMGRPDGKMLVASTAGAPSGFFYELVRAQEERPQDDWYLFRSKEVLNPNTSRDELRRIMAVGSRAGELRNLDNEFAAEGDELLSRDVIDAAINKRLTQHEDSALRDTGGKIIGRYDCWAFLDISIKRDLTSLVIVGRADPEQERLQVLRIVVWDPRKMAGKRIQFAPIRQELTNAIQNFRPRRLLVDTASGGGELINWALRSGYMPPIEEMHPSAKSNQEMWGTLRDVLNERKLEIPNHTRLVDELRGLKTKEYAQGLGFRVVDPSKRLHRDISFALAGATWAASQDWRLGQVKMENFDDFWRGLNGVI